MRQEEQAQIQTICSLNKNWIVTLSRCEETFVDSFFVVGFSDRLVRGLNLLEVFSTVKTYHVYYTLCMGTTKK